MEPTLQIALDGTSRLVSADLWRVRVDSTPQSEAPLHVSVRPGTALRWEELDRLGQLVELDYVGDDPGVVDYVARRQTIVELSWTTALLGRVALAASALRSLHLVLWAESGSTTLELPATLGHLQILELASSTVVRCEHASNGAGVTAGLTTRTGAAFRSQVRGLGCLPSLDLCDAETFSLAAVAALMPELEELTLRGPPGRVNDLSNIALLPKLRRLEIADCYDIELADFAGPLPQQVDSRSWTACAATIHGHCGG